MRVSLILATVGRTTEVDRCLQSIVRQTDSRYDVLVVDQNADDRLASFLLKAVSSGVLLQHLRLHPPSLSRARNMGLAQATGDVIGLTDDDCWYDGEAIRCIREAFLADPMLDGVVIRWVEQADATGLPASSELLSYEKWRRYRGGDASSISLFFKRSLLEKHGGFDARFGVGCWFGAAEEIDFLLRALSDGARIRRLPSARVHHLYSGQPTGSMLEFCRASRRRARGTGGIYAKHRMSPLIFLRGFISPIIKPLLRGQIKGVISGAFVALGRVEGYMAWLLKEAK